MDAFDAIHSRRSILQFTGRSVSREAIERILDAATTAPNHRLTQPWRFYVLGPIARRQYGETLGARKARKVDDPDAARALVEKVAASEAALPAMIAVSMTVDENPETHEENYAATMMAVQNLLLAAHAIGLGSHLKTGAVMNDPRTRVAIGVPDGEQVVATIQLGEPAAVPDPKPRRAARDVTTWVP